MKITNTVKLARRAKDFVMELVHWRTLVLMKKTRKENLADSDLIQPDDSEKSHNLGIELQNLWKAELIQQKIRGRKPSLHRVVYKMFWRSYIISGMMLAAVALLRLSQPIFITKLLEYVSVNSEAPTEEINKMIGILVAVLCLRFGLFNYYLYYTNIVGLRVRIACSYLIFVKMLEEDVNSKRQIHPVNLLSNDVARLEIAIPQIQWLWVGPLFLVATSIITYVFYDYVVLLCVVVVYLVCGVIVFGLGKLSSKLRTTIAACTDKRLRLMTELIGGIQIIKLYAWEEAFQQIIEKARRKEVRNTMFANVVKGVSESFYLVIDRVQYVLILLCSVIMGQKLLTYEIFGTLLILLLAKAVVTRNMPIAFSLKLEYNRSLDRIQSFLFSDKEKVNKKTVVKQLERGCVVLNEMSASWDGGSETLHGINISLHPGAFCAVVGPVGSGKTSLLHVLMSELRPSKGVMELGGSVSYAAQEPWTFHGTVRENILFGQELEQTRYDEVIRVCGLKTDLEQLSHGDGTLVGERGVKLSGGQRSRISLARAIYRKADIYLLDDPLSSVDSRMSKYLFKECILKFLKNKTRIIATHHIHSLPLADLVIVMNKGSIQYQGSFRELRQSGISLRSYVNVELNDMGYSGSNERKNRKRYFAEIHEETKTSKSFIRGYKMEDVWRYLRTGGGAFGFMIYITFIAGSVVSFYTYNIIVGLWDRYVHRDRLSSMLLPLYALIATVLLAALRSVVASVATLRTSSLLHASMARAVLGAKMEVFHDTPAGSLLAYFTEDVDVLDKQLPKTAEWLMMGLAFCVADICMVGYINQYTLISMLPLTVLAIAKVRLCSMTLRNCKLLENTKRAKYFALVNDAASGLTVVRAFKKTNHILNNFQSNEDDYTSSKMLTAEVGTTQWFIVSLISACIISLNIFILLKTGRVSDTTLLCFAFLFTMFNEESVGIVTEQIGKTAIELPSIRNCFTIADMEQEEDVVQYGDKVEIMKPDWPNGGEIEFRNVSLKYSEDGPKILRNVSFVINAGEKIGLVGRTGAGKSSLLQALLRLATVEDDGAILVNFVDTRHVPLQVLRRSITFIPQDPVMFSGSVRDNLDPLHENLDAMLWDALRRVELVEHVQSLDSSVEEKGSNWSVGEKQLLCLARAFLRNSRILLLDEATASVDQETNTLIQKSLKQLFEPCTIITIAHRISSIMDNDRILVMDSGRLVEFGKPSRLLNNVHSHFYKMVRDAGREMSEQMSLISREETRY